MGTNTTDINMMYNKVGSLQPANNLEVRTLTFAVEWEDKNIGGAKLD